MRKKIVILLTFLTVVLAAHATDGVSVSEASASKGNAGTITIALDNDSYTFTAFSFKLTLPKGLSFVTETDSENKVHPTFTPGDRYADHGLGSALSGQTATFTCFSINSYPISGTSGTLLTVNIKADASLVVGTDVTATLSELTFTTTDAQEVNFADLPFAVSITDPTILLDENSTTMPEAAEGVDVRVKRTIKTGNLSTICLPFAMTGDQAKAAFGADAELADFAGYETIEDDDENTAGILVKFTALDIADGMEANHPYVIRIHTESDVKEFTAQNVDIDPEEDPTIATVKRTKRQWSELIGTYVAGTELEATTIFLNGNKFWYSTGETKMKAYRAYFDFYDVLTDVENKLTSDANIRYVIEEATAISDIATEGTGVNEGWYTIDGLKLNGKPAQKGIYIKDGVKVRL